MKNLYARFVLIVGIGIAGFCFIAPTKATAIGEPVTASTDPVLEKAITDNEQTITLEQSNQKQLTTKINIDSHKFIVSDTNRPNILEDIAAQKEVEAQKAAKLAAEKKAAAEKAAQQQAAAAQKTAVTPQASTANVAVSGRQVVMNTSAYDAFSVGTGLTASGYQMSSASDKVVAAGPSFPFGTRIYIPGYGTATVVDRGSSITDGHLDLQMPYASSLQWGRRSITVTILN